MYETSLSRQITQNSQQEHFNNSTFIIQTPKMSHCDFRKDPIIRGLSIEYPPERFPKFGPMPLDSILIRK